MTSKQFSKDDGHAIPMVNFDMEKGKFFISPEAIEVLKSLDSPLGVISVAGMYRTGKSYLLNRMLLNRSGGFSVGPSINPCTKGLWMWNKPIPAHTPDGQPINVIIIDTEGIGATDEDHNHDNKIMTLAILLSSYFLFNSLGTIDENAIQNLSFIVNITKNILSKNNGSNFSMYLPSFMWVVRDFNLELKNLDGEPITSRQYLERTLELQKGNSDFIKSKNQIRQMVKEYFVERDCVTLIRPLMDESSLQNLEKVEDRKLRKEFLDQINALRKTVLNSIKPKQLNGQLLNGEMLMNLLNSYVEMINKGAVPVIQSAWTYMCQNECVKAQENSIELYNKKFKELEMKFPMTEEELKLIHKQMKKEALDNYTSSAIGDFDHAKYQKLKDEIKAQKKKLFEKNFEATKTATNNFLQLNFRTIEDKIKNNSYKSINDYKDDIEHFVSFAVEKCPDGPHRDVYIYEFIINNIMNHSNILTKNNITEMEQLINSNKAELSSMNAKVNDQKTKFDELKKELQTKTELLNKLTEEKNTMTSHSQSENDKISKLIDEKTNQIERLKSKLEEMEKDSEANVKEMKLKVVNAEKAKHEKEIEFTETSSKFEKEKVLMEQKIVFLEKNLKTLSEQQARLNATMNSLNTTQKGELSPKEKIAKFEAEIKKLNNEINSLSDKNIDLESKLLQKGRRIENEKTKIEEMLSEYQKKLSDINSSNELLLSEIKQYKIDSGNESSAISGEYEKEINDLTAKSNEMTEKFSEIEKDLKAQLTRANNELSLLKQENENAEKKINDIKTKFQNDKKEFDRYTKVLEENNSELLNQYEASEKENKELKVKQSTELSELTGSNSQKESELISLNEKLKKELSEISNEFTSKIKNLTDKLSENEKKIIPQFKLKISEVEVKIEEYKKELNDLRKTNKEAIEELIFEHNNSLQELLSKTREEIEDANNQNEKNIDEIRKICEIEKSEIEAKIKEENDTAKDKLISIEAEQEEKMASIEKEKNDKIDELQSNLDECDRIHDNYVTETDQEMALKMQQIDSLNKFLSDAKNSLNTIQAQHEASIKVQNERFEIEKKEINDKIASINEENSKLEEEYNNLLTLNDEYSTSLTEISSKVENEKINLQKEKEENEAKLKELIEKLNSKSNELNLNKANYAKEISLKQQEIDFLSKKLDEIKTQLEEFKATFEMKINQARELIIEEFTERINAVQSEKDSIEISLSQIKKQYKELEDKYKTETEQLTKEKESLIDGLNKVTIKKKELTEALEKEREESANIIQNIKNEFKAKNDILLKENEALNSKMKKIENDYQELNALYTKDQNIWSNKHQYLEEQRDMAKKELAELKLKYDANMDDLQKKILSERERLKGIYDGSVAQREDAYNVQLENVEKMFTDKFNEVNEQNKNLFTENKTLLDKIARYENDNLLNEIDSQLKIALDTEAKLQSQFDTMNSAKTTKIEELTAKLSTERENYQGKIAELERKLQEYEGRKANIATDIVKQKAVNEKDKENKVNLIQNLKEKLCELEKTNARLVAENKEVQREKEQIRKSSRNSSLSHNSSTGYIPKYKMNSNYMSNKENLRTQQNVQVDRLDLLPLTKKVVSPNMSKKGEEENIE